MVLARIFIALILVGAPAAATHVEETDIQWACGPGGFEQQGHPDACGINPVNTPEFGPNWLADEDRVLVVTHGGVERAYPVKALNRHEIVNDQFGEEGVAVTYCPLCGSGVSFLRGERNFTASGFLYQHDLVMMDSNTNTLWNQILGEPIGTLVNGSVRPNHMGEALQFVPTVVTTAAQWGRDSPMMQPVLAPASYVEQAYGDYADSCAQGVSGAGPCDIAGLHPKERMITLQLESERAWPVRSLHKVGVLLDELDGVPLVLAAANGTVRVFDSTGYSFHADGNLHVDQHGRTWDLGRGVSVDGAHQLPPIAANTAYWFAWKEHHPDTSVWLPQTTQQRDVHTPVLWLLAPVAIAAWVLWRR